MVNLEYLFALIPTSLALILLIFNKSKKVNVLYYLLCAFGGLLLAYSEKTTALLIIMFIFLVQESISLHVGDKKLWIARYRNEVLGIFLSISFATALLVCKILETESTIVENELGLKLVDYFVLILALIMMNITFFKRRTK